MEGLIGVGEGLDGGEGALGKEAGEEIFDGGHEGEDADGGCEGELEADVEGGDGGGEERDDESEAEGVEGIGLGGEEGADEEDDEGEIGARDGVGRAEIDEVEGGKNEEEEGETFANEEWAKEEGESSSDECKVKAREGEKVGEAEALKLSSEGGAFDIGGGKTRDEGEGAPMVVFADVFFDPFFGLRAELGEVEAGFVWGPLPFCKAVVEGHRLDDSRVCHEIIGVCLKRLIFLAERIAGGIFSIEQAKVAERFGEVGTEGPHFFDDEGVCAG